MIQNEDLTLIGVKLGEAIALDQGVADYCNTYFGKELAIYVAPDATILPEVTDAPYLFIHDLAKREGAMNMKPEYQAIFVIGIQSKSAYAITGNGVTVPDGQQRASELLTLVQTALNNYKGGCQPPASVEAYLPGIVGSDTSHWQAWLAATWQLELPLGYTREF
ncbi:hypothetical protein [Phascolarctobacterium sp.]|uniref:hypothetical protein n=1 Tax=Phascolarctobacterium sp. TaxID=2049039 RepID=UPI003863104D